MSVCAFFFLFDYAHRNKLNCVSLFNHLIHSALRVFKTAQFSMAGGEQNKKKMIMPANSNGHREGAGKGK